jgi:uncharacterized membrane protein (UPF0127 family)
MEKEKSILRITNLSKNTVLATEVELADNPYRRMKGLLGRANLSPGQGLIIKPCSSIHTFFMRFAIDVAFLDKENKIIKIIENLVPFRFTPLYFKAAFAVELPAGTLKASQTQAGDFLTISE